MMQSTHPERYQQAVHLFNEGDYFETHEELEDLWNETTGPERLYYQAILQAAVALHHFTHGNRPGALSLNRNYREKIDRLPFTEFMGLNLLAFVEQMDVCFEPLIAAGDDEWVQIDPARVPTIPLCDNGA